MHTYNFLHAGWSSFCPNHQRNYFVKLFHFKKIEKFADSAPAVYSVFYECVCSDVHHVLFNQNELDYQFLAEELPVFYDFMTGRNNWQRGGTKLLWEFSIRKGHWPLKLHCSEHESPVFAFPSCLKSLDNFSKQKYLVNYQCPSCLSLNVEVMTEKSLSLLPL